MSGIGRKKVLRGKLRRDSCEQFRVEMNPRSSSEAEGDLETSLFPPNQTISTVPGTSRMQFVPTGDSFLRTLNDGEPNLVAAQIQCITAMQFYKNYSMEELRLDDYRDKLILVPPSDATQRNFTSKRNDQYGAVIDLTKSCEDPYQDFVCWPVQSSEPDYLPYDVHTQSSNSSGDLTQCSGQRSVSILPYTDTASEMLAFFANTRSALVKSSVDEAPAVTRHTHVHSRRDLCKMVDGCLYGYPSSDDEQDSINSDKVTRTAARTLPSSDSTVAVLADDKAQTSASGLDLISATAEAVNSSTHICSASKADDFNFSLPAPLPFHSRGHHRKELNRAENLPAVANMSSRNQNHTNSCINWSVGHPLLELNTGHGKHFNRIRLPDDDSDALIDEISRLTDLLKSLCATIGQTNDKETLCWKIIDELKTSRDIRHYQKMPQNLLCVEAKNREMMTQQLIYSFERMTGHGQLHHAIQIALIEEFGFINNLKKIMITKSIENGRHKSEERDGHSVFAEYPDAISNSRSLAKDIGRNRRVRFEPEGDAKTSACKHVSDLFAQRLLNHDDDVLLFSEPGKLFRFEVQPGSRFVESWKRRGNGIVSLYQDATAEMIKIVVSHWSAKNDYTLILIRSSMKTKMMTTRNGLQLKFMGLEVSKCREKMRYFMLHFESSKVTRMFIKLLRSLPFLKNLTYEVAESCSTCCLDVVFKSQRIHDEFPLVVNEDEPSGATDDVSLSSTKGVLFDGEKFNLCSNEKKIQTGDMTKDAQKGDDSFRFEDEDILDKKSRNSGKFIEQIDVAKIPETEFSEREKFCNGSETEFEEDCDHLNVLKSSVKQSILDEDKVEVAEYSVIEDSCCFYESFSKSVEDYLTGSECKSETEAVKSLSEDDEVVGFLSCSIPTSSSVSSPAPLWSPCSSKHSNTVLPSSSGAEGEADVDNDSAVPSTLENVSVSAPCPRKENSELSLESQFQSPSVDDCESTQPNDEDLGEHDKIVARDSCEVDLENDIGADEEHPTRTFHPISSFTSSEFSLLYPDGTSCTTEETHSTEDSLECCDRDSGLDRASYQQEADDICQIASSCCEIVEENGFECGLNAHHTAEFGDNDLVGGDDDDLCDQVRLEFDGSEVAKYQKENSDVALCSRKVFTEFLSCNDFSCETNLHLTRMLDTLDDKDV